MRLLGSGEDVGDSVAAAIAAIASVWTTVAELRRGWAEGTSEFGTRGRGPIIEPERRSSERCKWVCVYLYALVDGGLSRAGSHSQREPEELHLAPYSR